MTSAVIRQKRVRKAHESYQAVAASFNCTVSEPLLTGKDHFKWIVEHTSGERLFMFTAQSPSDHRAMKNALSTLKNLCRQLVEKSRSTV